MHAAPPPPCVFLDRDGTLIHDRHYLSDPAGVELLPGAVEGLLLLQAARCPLVVLSNQSGVGRGYFDTACVDRVNARLTELLHAHGIRLTGMLYCPHTPEEACPCRKPAPGLAHEAARRWGLGGRLRAGHCVSVGDKPCDVRLAQGLGGRGLLLAPPAAFAAVSEAGVTPDHISPDLLDAARWIAHHWKLNPGHLP